MDYAKKLKNINKTSKQVGKNKKTKGIEAEKVSVPFMLALIAFIILFCLVISFVSKKDIEPTSATSTDATSSEAQESTTENIIIETTDVINSSSDNQ